MSARENGSNDAAPAAGEALSISVRADGVARLCYDVPGASVNTLHGRFVAELEAALASFEGLHAPDDIDANRLQVVSLTESLPLVQFAEKYPSTVGLADLALLNRVQADGTLAANSLIKRVVAGEAVRPQP